MNDLRGELTDFFENRYKGAQGALVFGEGPRNAAVALVGEAPGGQEAATGRPFVGKAGKNLDEFLAVSGFAREEVYITNVVKFRPTRLSEAGRRVNRTPSREEVGTFLPWLLREIERIRPALVVTLGNIALRAFLGDGARVGEAHGRFVERGGQMYYPMYHPASVIYRRALRTVYLEDVRRLAEWRERRERPRA